MRTEMAWTMPFVYMFSPAVRSTNSLVCACGFLPASTSLCTTSSG